MSDLEYKTSGNEIHFRNGKIARFEHPVSEILPFGDFLVVLIWPPLETAYNENIFGVDLSGNILWQIEPQYPNTEKNGAFGAIEDIDGYAVVSNIKNLVLYLDPTTGKVVKRKYPPR